jgi:hypothetical protein
MPLAFAKELKYRSAWQDVVNLMVSPSGTYLRQLNIRKCKREMTIDMRPHGGRCLSFLLQS